MWLSEVYKTDGESERNYERISRIDWPPCDCYSYCDSGNYIIIRLEKWLNRTWNMALRKINKRSGIAAQ